MTLLARRPCRRRATSSGRDPPSIFGIMAPSAVVLSSPGQPSRLVTGNVSNAGRRLSFVRWHTYPPLLMDGMRPKVSLGSSIVDRGFTAITSAQNGGVTGDCRKARL